MKFVVIICERDDVFEACCPILGVASQGDTVEDAVINIKEGVALYVECFPGKVADLDLPSEPLVTVIDV